MRLILEKSDLVEIIAKHFNARVDADSVVVRPDPFEVELKAFDKLEFQEEGKDVEVPPERPRNPARVDADASTEPPAPSLIEQETRPDDGLSPLSVLAESKALEEQLRRGKPTQEPQRAHSGSTEPPGDFQDELT